MQSQRLSVRHAVTAIACAAALVTLTACEDDTATEGTDAKASPAAESSPAAEPNGIQKKTAKQIYDESHAANAAAKSFHEKMTREGASSDLSISATECAGDVTIDAQGSFSIVRKDDDVWAKVDSSFADWVNSELGSDALTAGTWYHGDPAGDLMKNLLSWCHSEQLTEPDTLDDTDSEVTRAEVTTVDGQQVVPVVMSGSGETVKWYAATTGEPYFVRQESSREDMTDVVYSGFGTPVGAQKPSGTVKEVPEL